MRGAERFQSGMADGSHDAGGGGDPDPSLGDPSGDRIHARRQGPEPKSPSE